MIHIASLHNPLVKTGHTTPATTREFEKMSSVDEQFFLLLHWRREEILGGQPADLATDLKQRNGEGLGYGNHIGKKHKDPESFFFELHFFFELL